MANERITTTKQRMDDAERALRDFVERPDRTGSIQEIRQHRELAERLTRAIEEHLEALLHDRR